MASIQVNSMAMGYGWKRFQSRFGRAFVTKCTFIAMAYGAIHAAHTHMTPGDGNEWASEARDAIEHLLQYFPTLWHTVAEQRQQQHHWLRQCAPSTKQQPLEKANHSKYKRIAHDSAFTECISTEGASNLSITRRSNVNRRIQISWTLHLASKFKKRINITFTANRPNTAILFIVRTAVSREPFDLGHDFILMQIR